MSTNGLVSTTSTRSGSGKRTSLTAFIRCVGMICAACAITLSGYLDPAMLP